MYSYHADLIWAVDKILLCLVTLAALLTIFYLIIKDYCWKRRSRALLNIKRNIYELALSGAKTDNNVCLPMASTITSQQFLDVTTNRNREMAFFNESEQKIMKSCFVSGEKLALIEKTALFSWSKWRRVEAILILGYAQAVSSLSTLKKTINDKDFDISYFSIIALGQIKNIQSAGILLDFVKVRPIYRYRIFSILESFPHEIAEEVIKLTGGADYELQSWAIKLICKFRALQYTKKIEGFTKNKSAQVRASACDCLGEFGNKDSAGVIIKCLSDGFWMVRVSAVKALFKVLGKDSLPEIMDRINDGSLSVIESVKEMMSGNIEVCLPYVEKFLHGNDEMARRVSVESLEASGYIIKLFRNMLIGNERDKERFTRLLKGLIVSHAYSGLEVSLLSFSMEERGRLLGIIRSIDASTAAILEEDTKGQKGKF